MDPHFAFTDPPFRHSLPVTLTLAATPDPSTAVLSGCTAIAGTSPGMKWRLRPADTGDMVRVSIAGHLGLTAAGSSAQGDASA